MEYLTYLLLIVGILLVAGGIFLSTNEKKIAEKNDEIAGNDSWRENIQRIEAKLEKLGLSNPHETRANTSEKINEVASERDLSHREVQNHVKPEIAQESGYQAQTAVFQGVVHHGQPSSFTQGHTQQRDFKMPQISPVYVSHHNPKLYSKNAQLYLDSGNSNSYTGHENKFEIRDVVGIKRFGQGWLSYDGHHFTFEHPQGVENFSMMNIDHIAFYPNCVVLASKHNLPSALFFLDETSTLRDVLKTFQLPE